MLASTFSNMNRKSQIKASADDIVLLDCASTTRTGFRDCDDNVKICFNTCAARDGEFACIKKCPELARWSDVDTTASSVTVYYKVTPKRTQALVKCRDMCVFI